MASVIGVKHSTHGVPAVQSGMHPIAIMVWCLLTCGMAQASEWVSLGTSDNGQFETFIDVSSIRVEGSIRRAWVKAVFAPHTARGLFEDANKWMSYEMIREAYNCGEEAFRFEAQNSYYEDGTYDSIPAKAYPRPWRPTPPDSVASLVMQFICARKPK